MAQSGASSRGNLGARELDEAQGKKKKVRLHFIIQTYFYSWELLMGFCHDMLYVYTHACL